MTSYPYPYPATCAFLSHSVLGRGGRAMGGRALGKTLKRRVRLDVFFAPYVAKCLFHFFGSPSNLLIQKDFSNKHRYILLIEDITCLCLNKSFFRCSNLFSLNGLRGLFRFRKRRNAIQKGSFGMSGPSVLREF